MKKIITLSLCILSLTFVNSQDLIDIEEDASSDFKQNQGNHNLELQFDPGAIFNASNGNNVFSNGLGIRYRYFTSKSIAFRLNVDISYANSKRVTQDANENLNLEELTLKNTYIGVSLRPGIEKHFSGTKRLSPYIGGEIILGYQTGLETDEYQIGTDVYALKTKNDSFNDGLTFGIAGVAGADYYIVRNLYLGLELNYGLYYFSPFTTKISTTQPNIDDIETKTGKSSGIIFTPSAMGVFRIGFLF